MARRSSAGTFPSIAQEYERQAADAEERAALIRRTLMCDGPSTKASPDMPRVPNPKANGPVVRPHDDDGTMPGRKRRAETPRRPGSPNGWKAGTVGSAKSRRKAVDAGTSVKTSASRGKDKSSKSGSSRKTKKTS
jgi:hypothetical protein